MASAGLAYARGSLLTHLHEEDLRDAEWQLNLTLTDDGWVELLEQKYAHLLIMGLSSPQSEPSGWNAQYRDWLRPRHVQRVSPHVVTITLPSTFSSYSVTAPETVTVKVPASAVTSNAAVDAIHTAVVLNDGEHTARDDDGLMRNRDHEKSYRRRCTLRF